MMLEELESRRLLSTSSAVVSNKILTVTGTTGRDSVSFAAGKTAFTVNVNGQSQTFSNKAVKLIRIFTDAGNDSIIVSPHLNIRCSIESGSGNDRIGGSANDDTILSGSGNDTVVGNDGDDYLDAGPGDDHLEGGMTMHGGGGTDEAILDSTSTITSGIEQRAGISPAVNGELRAADGKLYLDLTVELGSGGDRIDLAGPFARTDGEQEVRFTYDNIGGGANIGSAHTTVDITNAQTSGLIFRNISGYGNVPTNFEQVVLLPAK